VDVCEVLRLLENLRRSFLWILADFGKAAARFFVKLQRGILKSLIVDF
jgi:hypothetical protein